MKNKRKNWGQSEFEEARLATRIALLASEEILIPASSYFESQLCRTVIDEYKELFGDGYIYLVAKVNSFDEYFDRQLEEYKPNSLPFQTYSKLLRTSDEYPPLRMRFKSSTKDIVKSWNDLIEYSEKPTEIIEDLELIINLNEFERNWKLVPEKLGNLGFVVEHVRPLLFGEGYNLKSVNNALHSVINQLYFKSYTDEYKASVVTDLVYLKAPFRVYGYGKGMPYKKVRTILKNASMLEEFMSIPVNRLLYLKYDPRWTNILIQVLSDFSESN